jgi:uncharacterized protein YjbJ (UPF0337 family)
VKGERVAAQTNVQHAAQEFQPGRTPMNWEQVEGKWKQYTGKVREKWGKLTDSDLEMIKGQRQQLVGKIQERYGIAKEDAERQVNEFTSGLFEDDTAREERREDKARRAGR